MMNEISRYVPITKEKNDLLDLIRKIESVDEAVAITKKRRPRGGNPEHEKYAAASKNSRFSATTTVKSLRASIRQAREDRWLSSDEVFRR
jgi:hypothetical protein